MDHDCGIIPESDFIYFDEKGHYWIGVDGENIAVGPIQYCPYCGSKLEVDPDAVLKLKESLRIRRENEKKKEESAIKEVNDILFSLECEKAANEYTLEGAIDALNHKNDEGNYLHPLLEKSLRKKFNL